MTLLKQGKCEMNDIEIPRVPSETELKYLGFA